MIDPRALRTFHQVCQTGSISAAARSLNISQPSVSAAIAQLETRLGGRLFERTRTGIVLTAEGEALAARARMLDHLLRDAEEDVAATRAGLSAPLRVGGTPGALVSLLPRALALMEAQHPRIMLNVVERPDRDLLAMLRDGEIDLAFVTTGIEPPAPDMEERTLARDPFALIVGRANDSLPDRFSLREAAKLRWVLPEAQGAFRRQVDALFLAAGVAVPTDAVRCDSLLTTKAIVRSSTRVTILPMQVSAAELSIGVLRAIALEEASFERSIGARWLKGRSLSPLAAMLLSQLAA
ncbi:MAG: LysR family transcriptional regulator [Sphingomonadales bacterium]|nr:LysR family transcriptional regulator [Sphingomonadales bacterium]MDE2167855.1 LysR family transcriptional regulator [Sphingomonadales bacterium]